MQRTVYHTQSTPTCLKEHLEQLLDAVVSHTEPTGRLVSELFQKLPSKVVGPPRQVALHNSWDPGVVSVGYLMAML